ncbi:MAG: LysE family translocator [Flavobacteriaceae bacterium]
MNISEFTDALILGFFLAFMIGPVFFMLLQTSILYGARRAIAFDLGAITGDAAFIAIAFYGSKPALDLIKDDPLVFILGGGILISYGVLSYFNKQNRGRLQDPELTVNEKNPTYLGLFFKGFFLNFINIGVLGFWLAMIVLIGPSLDMESNHFFQYFGTILLGYFLTDLIKIQLAKQLKSKITPAVSFKLKRVLALVFIVFGVFLLIKGFLPSDAVLPEELNNFIQGE